MNKKVVIELADLSVGYKQELLQVPSLQFHEGEVISVIGKNGSGKSTLLRTVGGLIEPLAGQVSLAGTPIQKLSAKEVAQLLSFVFTHRPNSMLLVQELVALGRFPWLGVFGTKRDVDVEMIERAMARTHIAGWRKKRLGELSDGEQQRVMIAKALAQDGKAMLLDEPTAFLDVAHKIELISLLQTIAKEDGKCVIMTTHDLQLALDRSDRILVILDQHIHIGTPEEIIKQHVIERMLGSQHLAIDKAGRVRYK